ncbi:hypothetical protein INT48_006963 [Thamnidium elegans]|uniref:Uncharacterized protein n=1 Tax=Thamnidium elegans TaxID=101142 RepID=A0A8H7SWE3_9FUNG|nr:hypothetical protein INT48_006963 [Thamnidium elegans]
MYVPHLLLASSSHNHEVARYRLIESSSLMRKATDDNEGHEVDGVLSADEDIYAGTNVKREAKRMYERYHSLNRKE